MHTAHLMLLSLSIGVLGERPGMGGTGSGSELGGLCGLEGRGGRRGEVWQLGSPGWAGATRLCPAPVRFQHANIHCISSVTRTSVVLTDCVVMAGGIGYKGAPEQNMSPHPGRDWQSWKSTKACWLFTALIKAPVGRVNLQATLYTQICRSAA